MCLLCTRAHLLHERLRAAECLLHACVCVREQVRVRACFCARDLHVSEWSCFILFHHQCVSGMLADREMAKPYVFGSALSLPPCRCEKHFFLRL